MLLTQIFILDKVVYLKFVLYKTMSPVMRKRQGDIQEFGQ